MSLLSELGQRNIMAHKHASMFRNTFNRSLVDFWNPFWGFDIVKFDDEVVKSGNKQCRAVLRKKFGEKAERLIEALIKL